MTTKTLNKEIEEMNIKLQLKQKTIKNNVIYVKKNKKHNHIQQVVVTDLADTAFLRLNETVYSIWNDLQRLSTIIINRSPQPF